MLGALHGLLANRLAISWATARISNTARVANRRAKRQGARETHAIIPMWKSELTTDLVLHKDPRLPTGPTTYNNGHESLS
jgi:hypothetical protein